MKKLFINPEIRTVELAPDSVIMASSDIASANAVTYGASDEEINTAYGMWKGKKTDWIKK